MSDIPKNSDSAKPFKYMDGFYAAFPRSSFRDDLEWKRAMKAYIHGLLSETRLRAFSGLDIVESRGKGTQDRARSLP